MAILKTYRKLYQHRYSVSDHDLFSCAYCGKDFEVFDHVPPLAIVRELPQHDFSPYLMVPSCNKCNSILGGHSMLLTVESRKLYLKKKRLSKARA